MKVSGAALVAVCAVALAACSSSSGESPTTVASSPTELPAVTAPALPTPTASASPAPAITTEAPAPTETAAPAGDPCKDPGVSAAGLAPIAFNRYADICVGMSFSQASDAMPGPVIAGQAACPWYADVLAADDPGLYVSAISRPENPGERIFMFRMVWQGSLANAASFPAPETAQGISVGSTTADVQAAYPGATTVSIDDPSLGPRTQLVVSGRDDTSLVFDVTEGRVSSVYWGERISNGSVAELCAL